MTQIRVMLWFVMAMAHGTLAAVADVPAVVRGVLVTSAIVFVLGAFESATSKDLNR